jgi:2-polyprenyl-3-methyl-5-hydroxy-6-metoxy-1,4-benzoquinol methylase
MKKNLITKKICLCGGKLRKRISFGTLPIINDFKTIKTSKYPTVITQCSKCLLIQLKYSIKDELVFPKNYSYLSGDSKEKIESYKLLISKIKSKYKIKKPTIVDIGGNDGSFMGIAKKDGFNVLNIEPTNTAKIAKKNNIKTLQTKFDLKQAKNLSQKKNQFDFIVSTNFFAHTNNLEEIIYGTKLILKKNGIMIIEIQYLYNLLKKNGFDSFHQDHKYYYTLSSIRKIFKVFNLNVFDAEFSKNNKEILRVYISASDKTETKKLKKIIKSENDKIIFKKIQKLNNFRKNYLLKFKKIINKFINKNKTIYALGAAPRGCVLLNAVNFSNKEIKMVGEVSNSFKLNKFIPGTNIIIKNEDKIIKEQPDFVIILAWHLKERLTKNLVKNGYKGKFIIPLPKLKISI